MQDKNFEHQVKDLLYNHEEAAPNVMNNVFEKRTPLYVFKNKLILNKYKLIAAAALIGVLAFLINYNVNNTNTVEPAIDNTISNKQPAIVQSEEKPTQIESNNTAIINEVNSDADEDLSNETINNSVKSEQNQVAVTNTTQGGEDKLNQLAKIKQQLAGANNSGIGDTDQGYIGQQDPTTDESNNVNQKDASLSTGGEQIETRNAVAQQDQNKSEKLADKIDASTTNSDQNLSEETDAVTADANVVETTKNEVEVDGTGEDNEFIVPATKPRNWSLSVNALAGIGSRNLDQTGDLATVIVRDNTESAKFSYGTELLLNYRVLDNLEVYGGFGYFNRRESMQYTNVTQMTDMDISSKQVIEHHPVFGTRTVTVYDTTYTNRNVETTGAANNSYEHYYVPLGLRYTLFYNKQFGMHIALNGGLEIATKTSGTVLNNKYEEVSLTNGFARASVGNMLGAGVGVSYLVRERLNILAELKGNFFLSPTNNSSYPINQFDKGYGLSLGVKYDLK